MRFMPRKVQINTFFVAYFCRHLTHIGAYSTVRQMGSLSQTKADRSVVDAEDYKGGQVAGSYAENLMAELADIVYDFPLSY